MKHTHTRLRCWYACEFTNIVLKIRNFLCVPRTFFTDLTIARAADDVDTAVTLKSLGCSVALINSSLPSLLELSRPPAPALMAIFFINMQFQSRAIFFPIESSVAHKKNTSNTLSRSELKYHIATERKTCFLRVKKRMCLKMTVERRERSKNRSYRERIIQTRFLLLMPRQPNTHT
jgi:hypothetical protein